MFKRVLLSSLLMFVFAACSPQASNEALPTLATINDPVTSTPDDAVIEATEASPENAEAAGDTEMPGNLELVDTIESENGVTYKLPAGWYVNDNDRVSNFGSDEDAVLDYSSMDEEVNSRWIFLGGVSISTAEKVNTLEAGMSFEEATAALNKYYYTADSDLQPPHMVTLDNGKSASVSMRTNEEMSGKASATYFIEVGDGTYIKMSFQAREDILTENAELIDAIVNSAFVR